MPLKDYKCLDCGYIEECLIRDSSDELTHCPECKGTQMEQQISAIGGYQGSCGPSSTRPRGVGSFKRIK